MVIEQSAGPAHWSLLAAAIVGGLLAVGGGFLRQVWTDHRAARAAAVEIRMEISHNRVTAVTAILRIGPKGAPSIERPDFRDRAYVSRTIDLARTRAGRSTLPALSVLYTAIDTYGESTRSGAPADPESSKAYLGQLAAACTVATSVIEKVTGRRRSQVANPVRDFFMEGSDSILDGLEDAMPTPEQEKDLPPHEREVLKGVKETLRDRKK